MWVEAHSSLAAGVTEWSNVHETYSLSARCALKRKLGQLTLMQMTLLQLLLAHNCALISVLQGKQAGRRSYSRLMLMSSCVAGTCVS